MRASISTFDILRKAFWAWLRTCAKFLVLTNFWTATQFLPYFSSAFMNFSCSVFVHLPALLLGLFFSFLLSIGLLLYADGKLKPLNRTPFKIWSRSQIYKHCPFIKSRGDPKSILFFPCMSRSLPNSLLMFSMCVTFLISCCGYCHHLYTTPTVFGAKTFFSQTNIHGSYPAQHFYTAITVSTLGKVCFWKFIFEETSKNHEHLRHPSSMIFCRERW